jgi:hypothetical protein
MSSRRYYRRGVVWPLILVFIGAVLLLNNLGITDLSLWSLAIQLWPAILLAIGVDILIPRRSAWGTALAAVAAAAIFVGSFWLMGAVGSRAAQGEAVSQSADGIRTAEVVLEPAVATVYLDGKAGSGLLIEGTAAHPGRRPLTAEFSIQQGNAVFRLAPDYDPGVTVVLPWPQLIWDLSVADDLPLDLRTDLGVGELLLDLSDIEIEEASVLFGVGRAEITLPSGQPVDVSIDGGVGDILLRVPPGSSVQVQLPDGLTVERLPAGYIERGDVARSPEALVGDPEIVISVELGVGSVRVIESGF